MGFKDTYRMVKSDHSIQKKRGQPQLTEILSNDARVKRSVANHLFFFRDKRRMILGLTGCLGRAAIYKAKAKA